METVVKYDELKQENAVNYDELKLENAVNYDELEFESLLENETESKLEECRIWKVSKFLNSTIYS